MTNDPFSSPPIPAYLASYPTIGGMVIPYTALRHRNGTAAFGLVDAIRMAQCLRERRCGVCGQVMTHRMIFFMRRSDLIRKSTVEPGVCPPCAAYTQAVCPMVAGQMAHYRASKSPFLARVCGDPACDCEDWAPQSESVRYGEAAEPWYALWTLKYRLIQNPEGKLAASFAGLHVLALREVGRQSSSPDQ